MSTLFFRRVGNETFSSTLLDRTHQYFIVKASSGALGELSGKTVEKEPTTLIDFPERSSGRLLSKSQAGPLACSMAAVS